MIRLVFCDILICGFLTISLFSCKQQNTASPDIQISSPDFYQYNKKRSQALLFTPDNLDLTAEFEIYGIVMDWSLGDGRFVTVCAYKNGRAMLYTSDNTKNLDLQHNNIKNSIRPYLKEAMGIYSIVSTTLDPSLPKNNAVKFYLLTNLGIAQTGDTIERINRGISPLLNLFREANNVISEIRNTYVDFAQEVE